MAYDPDLRVRHGSILPHWEKQGASYSTCFRLADSVPQGKLKEWEEERKDILRQMNQVKGWQKETLRKKQEYFFAKKIDHYLDAGHGRCWLQRDDIAQIVADALWHFDGERYQLFAWCIMPNHVHVVLQTIAEYSLRDILYSWKKFTAGKANELLRERGNFWQSESFDHLIRNDEDHARSIEYVWKNPEVAGFRNWKWRWKAQ